MAVVNSLVNIRAWVLCGYTMTFVICKFMELRPRLASLYIRRSCAKGGLEKTDCRRAIGRQGSALLYKVLAAAPSPVCFILRRQEVQQLASQDANGGAYWLNPPAYDREEYREAWHRIGAK